MVHLRKKKQAPKWVSSRPKILKNLESSLSDVNYIIGEVDEIRRTGNSTFEFMIEKQQKLGKEIQLIKVGQVYDSNLALGGTIDHFVDLTKQDAEYTRHLRNRMGSLSTNYRQIQNSVQTSGTVYMSSLGTNTASIVKEFYNKDEFPLIIEQLNKPSPLDRRNELSIKLSKINPECSQLLDTAWKTIYNTSNPERFSQAAISMRNLMQRFLGHLGPDDKITAMKDYQPRRADKKGPSWTQRALYAITGVNEDLDQADVEYIEKIANNTKEELDRLSKLVKKRRIDGDLQNVAEKILDDCQIFLLNIIKARERYFKDYTP